MQITRAFRDDETNGFTVYGKVVNILHFNNLNIHMMLVDKWWMHYRWVVKVHNHLYLRSRKGTKCNCMQRPRDGNRQTFESEHMAG